MREKDVETTIRKHIKTMPLSWSEKLHADGFQGRSTVDLVGSDRGRPFWVEVKAPDGVLSSIQAFSLERARLSGYVSGCVSSVEEFRRLFDE